jgi:hypothetical protein
MQTNQERNPRDCIMLMGDFNGRLAWNIKGRTGQFTPHRQTDENGQLLLDLMLRQTRSTAASAPAATTGLTARATTTT